MAEAMQCRHCDTLTTTPAQAADLIEKTKKAHIKWIQSIIAQYQRELALSHRDLASAVGLGSATLSRAIKGDRLIDASTEELLLFKLAQLKEQKMKRAMLSLPAADFSKQQQTCSYRRDGSAEETAQLLTA